MGSASSLPALGFLSLYDKQALDPTKRSTIEDQHGSLTASSTSVHLIHVKESQLPIVRCSARALNLPIRSHFQMVISLSCPVEVRPGSLRRSRDQTGGYDERIAEGS